MGNNVNKLVKQEGYNVSIEGFYNAGKATILQKWAPDEFTAQQKLDSYVESLTFNKFNFLVLDLGGRCTGRAIHRQFLYDTNGLIYVVDSSDRQNLQDAKYYLHTIMKEPLQENVVLLVLANKQDVEGAVNVEEMKQILELHDIKQDYNIFGTCALTGEGLNESLGWLKDKLELKEQEEKDETDETLPGEMVDTEKSGKRSCKGPMAYLKKLAKGLKGPFAS